MKIGVLTMPKFSQNFFLLLCLITPAVVFVLGMCIFPAIWSVFLSLCRYDFRRGLPVFIGLGNYLKILKSPTFPKSLFVTLNYAVFTTLLSSLIGLGLALLFNQQFRGRSLIRGLLVIPWAVPWVVSAFLWASIFSSDFGILNAILYKLGIINDYVVFLSKDFAIYAVAIATSWNLSSLTAILCLAALQSIPESLYEAAAIDGATTLEIFKNITFPWVRPIWSLTIILNAFTAVTMFDMIYLMTAGGPGEATLTLPIYSFRTFFLEMRIGEGAAIANIASLLGLIVALIYFRIFYRRIEI